MAKSKAHGKKKKTPKKISQCSANSDSASSYKNNPDPPKRKLLMAPWRIEFILGPREPDCFFCVAAALDPCDQTQWKQRLLLYKNEHALIMMNKFPYTGGHLLIAPHRHTADLGDLNPEENASMWKLSVMCVDILKRVMHPQGLNMGMNLGKAAGAGVEDHLHMHVMPRWVGDTNFLPVIADTHTIPIALADLWDHLRPAFIDADRRSHDSARHERLENHARPK